MNDVRERCSCGAEIEIRNPQLPSTTKDTLAAWRAGHHCPPRQQTEHRGEHGGGATLETTWEPPGFTARKDPR